VRVVLAVHPLLTETLQRVQQILETVQQVRVHTAVKVAAQVAGLVWLL
jgi:hypothetical protein